MKNTTAMPQKKGRATQVIIAAAIGILLALGYGLWPQTSLSIGARAPGFSLSLFDSRELSLEGLQGQVVVVNFWASWCPPCRDEAPVLETVWREYKDKGVLFLGVNVNDVGANAMAFIEEFTITYPNGPDPYDRISRAYHRTGVPETYLISKDGLLVEHYIGPITEGSLRTALEGLLKQ